MDPKNLEKLKTSIRDLGFYRPVVVRTLPGNVLEILGGQHRTEAAIELGLKTIPVINLGTISDDKAKRIGLTDNARYGSDDAIKLAKLFDELKDEGPVLTDFLPMKDEDLQVIMRAVEIDLDNLGIMPEETHDERRDPGEPVERPIKTHDVLKFRLSVRDAEAIRALIEKTIKRESLSDTDDMTLAGSALAILVLGTA